MFIVLRSSSSCPKKGQCSDILHLDDHNRVKNYHQQTLEKLEANPLYLAFKESKEDTPLVLSYDENHNPVTLFVMDTDKKEVKAYDVNKICTCNPKDYEHASIIQHHPNLDNYHIHINECNKALSGYLEVLDRHDKASLEAENPLKVLIKQKINPKKV